MCPAVETKGKTMNNLTRYAVAAALIAVGMVVSSLLISRFLVRVRHEKEIKVKGFAEAQLTSDIGQLSATLYVQRTRRDEAYRVLKQQLRQVLLTLRYEAPSDAAFETRIPDFSAIYRLDAKGKRTNELECYAGSMGFCVASADVHWIKRRSADLVELIGEGLDIRVDEPVFLVSNLREVKLELLEKATADGYRRAELMANNSGSRVGALQAARQGVFQITEPNSTRTTSYGVYDTSTIRKSIRAVVTLEYAVE